MVIEANRATDQDEEVIGVALRVRGLVQGVGFRPTVWRLARKFELSGEVLNDGEGVLIRAWGSPRSLARFGDALVEERPPLARIDGIERMLLGGSEPQHGFRIVASEAGTITTGIVADAATCPDCRAEVQDPSNRRYRYPFTNCTHCGPRLSIVRAIPYDRASTSMVAFPMCEDCRAEYEDPGDRRFHAEPNACPVCGPRVWLEDVRGRELALERGEDAVAAAVRLIRAGFIVAIKGIGGFQLACDAANAEAVDQLRTRKRRYHKPFALMARDTAMVRAYADVTVEEARSLESSAGPIVIFDAATAGELLAPGVAPGQSTLGFMLPYTPLHHLLMRDLARPIVLTSGNLSDEPQCTQNDAARMKLKGVADYWLMHDRDIVNRLDDSVLRRIDGAPVLLRRARGFAPEPIRLPEGFAAAPRVLAMGAELKSTFCLVRGGEAIVSQHIGDLEEAATHSDFRAALDLYRRLFAFTPDAVAVDRHPDYLSTQWGRSIAFDEGARLIAVQHHHAHVAACLAEHGVPVSTRPVLGVVLDGLGLGDDGGLWGGEFLLCDYTRYERLASFEPVPLLGGAKAMREPWRNAFAHIEQVMGWERVAERYPDFAITRLLREKPVDQLRRMIATKLNSPLSSSAGRVFDAVAAVLGVYAEATSYEGQAAIEIEALAERGLGSAGDGYPCDIEEGAPLLIGWRAMWTALLRDLADGTAREIIAARFHIGLAKAVGRAACQLAARHGVETVALSGGVFQNRILLGAVAQLLRDAGLLVLKPRRFPANDGGLSLGQAVIAAAREIIGRDKAGS
ncbi:(NiFe) hydrogenase maturation protein HypF [Hyphomicrobium denitrificans 1NES1]|uniref:Carbamoyltransferase HypF n=1 Tax=Hyphomicrobium denitrificans 1NES1 TaxID=670307 RepID=N0B9Y2_9HYPH|nr:carbamoyltransferase HypF [Hyphomicrobium denitrificans]AGK57356.1 (NiFe) hydrogenase maturation protein HypF [Hyphomicrobium denitrificans 1NES1]